jgi:hypothetical protein
VEYQQRPRVTSFILRQQKTRHGRVHQAPAAARLRASPQQESSAHGGRVSGDSIPIYGNRRAIFILRQDARHGAYIVAQSSSCRKSKLQFHFHEYVIGKSEILLAYRVIRWQ